MAFLFQDQNQGIRNGNAHAKTREAAATVLFHPDFDRRLRNRTESADPSFQSLKLEVPKAKALAGLGLATLTAGGEFHPALRTSAARMDNLDETMANQFAPGKARRTGNPHIPFDPINDLGARDGRIRCAGLASRESDSGLFSKETM